MNRLNEWDLGYNKALINELKIFMVVSPNISIQNCNYFKNLVFQNLILPTIF